MMSVGTVPGGSAPPIGTRRGECRKHSPGRAGRLRGGEEVAEPEAPVPQDDLAGTGLHRLREDGAVEDEGVELAVLSARVGLRRELVQKGRIVEPPDEGAI